MKKYLILGILILIGIVFLVSRSNNNEYALIPWVGDGQYRTYDSPEGKYYVGDDTKKEIIGIIEMTAIRATLAGGDDKERYEIVDRILNPQRKESYFLFNDKQAIGGPYIGASVHVVSAHFDGTSPKDIATLEGYDIPRVTVSADGTKLHVEQLMKSGPDSSDIVLEKTDINLETK